MEKTDWYVHKFGGTSLANAKRYQAAAQIIKAAPGERAVVVSAMAGTTDTLIHLLNLAQAQDGG